MKAYFHSTLISLILLLTPALDCFAGGREFTVTTLSDSEITGELLSVRPDAILLLPRVNRMMMRDPLSVSNLNNVNKILVANIKVLHANADRHTGAGVVWGGLAGLAVGIFVGQAVHGEHSHSLGPDIPGAQVAAGMACVVAGAVAGGIIGNKASDEEINLIRPDANALLQLKRYARYPHGELEILLHANGTAELSTCVK